VGQLRRARLCSGKGALEECIQLSQERVKDGRQGTTGTLAWHPAFLVRRDRLRRPLEDVQKT
jgi:hypothetical protein